MNHIDELTMKIEAYPNKLITKTYILKLLRESQRHECEFCAQIPIYETSVPKNLFVDFTRGGD